MHSETVEEEVRPGAHALASDNSGLETRLAVVHAWVWIDNPAGPFTPENWALPYARVGLESPSGAPREAALALSLLTGDDEHGLWLVSREGRAVDRGVAGRQRVAFARAEIAEWLATRPAGSFQAVELEWLEETWTALADYLAPLPTHRTPIFSW